MTNLQVHTLALLGTDIFAGTENGIFLSTNNAANWISVNNGLTNLDIRTLAAWGNYLYAGSWGGGVFLSSNSGSSWNSVNSGLTNLLVNTLAIDDTVIFAGTEGGVYFSTNNGLNWIVKNEGIGSLNSVYAIDFKNNFVFAGLSNAVWSRPLDELIGVRRLNELVSEKFYLYQNYPNPFNPNSKIKFQTSKFSHVKLTVFDILGKEIHTLVNGELSPGTYEADFDGSNSPSGIYYYRLNAGDYIETKKMVLLK